MASVARACALSITLFACGKGGAHPDPNDGSRSNDRAVSDDSAAREDEDLEAPSGGEESGGGRRVNDDETSEVVEDTASDVTDEASDGELIADEPPSPDVGSQGDEQSSEELDLPENDGATLDVDVDADNVDTSGDDSSEQSQPPSATDSDAQSVMREPRCPIEPPSEGDQCTQRGFCTYYDCGGQGIVSTVCVDGVFEILDVAPCEDRTCFGQQGELACASGTVCARTTSVTGSGIWEQLSCVEACEGAQEDCNPGCSFSYLGGLTCDAGGCEEGCA